jgi:hypothetical protein
MAKRKKEKPMTTKVVVQPAPLPAVVEPMALTAQEIRANVNLIQTVLKSVFKKDVHYGIIPGTPKPTLYKPGAEKIMVLFRLNGKPVIEDLSTLDEIRYRVSVMITHQVTRHEIGWGVGECSSNETKYKWIGVKFPSDWEGTPEDRRREIWKQGKEKPYQVKQFRANISDVANTVLKMAKKRALVDATLTCTAASDVFDQDIEDMPEGLRANVASATPRPPMPQRASQKPADPVAQAPAQPPAEDQSQEEEQPPAAAAARKPSVNLKSAKKLVAKFDCPCKFCGTPILIGEDMLYIGDGPDKGRYCAAHIG